jgi:hypothetical protein
MGMGRRLGMGCLKIPFPKTFRKVCENTSLKKEVKRKKWKKKWE